MINTILEIKLNKNKLLFIIFGFIFFPLVANANSNANNKIDWVQMFNILKSIEVNFVNKPPVNKWVKGFELTKKEKLFFECLGYEYFNNKPKKCLSNYNRNRNIENFSFDHWSPLTSIYDWSRSNHSFHPKSFIDWNKFNKYNQ
mgnify:CR=1 FL=1